MISCERKIKEMNGIECTAGKMLKMTGSSECPCATHRIRFYLTASH